MNSDRLTTTIEGVVREVTKKTSANGKEYASLLLNVTESRKTGDKVFTLPMTAWHERKDRCLALHPYQPVTVTAKIGAYESKQGYHNVTLEVLDLFPEPNHYPAPPPKSQVQSPDLPPQNPDGTPPDEDLPF